MSRSRPITAARVLLVAAGAALAVIGLLVVITTPSLTPQGEQAKKSAAKPSELQQPAAKPSELQTPAATPATPVGGSGQRAFIDPVTGQLREPTPEEVQALTPARRTLRSALAPVPVHTVDGGEAIALGPDDMNYTVAVRNADGTISFESVVGKQNAEAAVKTHKQAAATKKEVRHDR